MQVGLEGPRALDVFLMPRHDGLSGPHTLVLFYLFYYLFLYLYLGLKNNNKKIIKHN